MIRYPQQIAMHTPADIVTLISVLELEIVVPAGMSEPPTHGMEAIVSIILGKQAALKKSS